MTKQQQSLYRTIIVKWVNVNEYQFFHVKLKKSKKLKKDFCTKSISK
jgi:hypothetical protein